MFLNKIWFVLESPNLQILTNFNYVFFIKYEFDQTFTNILFNVHYIKSVTNQ
jgi:hypothetical protein